MKRYILIPIFFLLVSSCAEEGEGLAEEPLPPGVEILDPIELTEEARTPFVTAALESAAGPFIISTDYMKSYAEQLRPYIPGSYTVLGTDGFGRSDTRSKLRKFFEVDRYFVTVAALKALADEGVLEAKVVAEALSKYGIDPEKTDPTTC